MSRIFQPRLALFGLSALLALGSVGCTGRSSIPSDAREVQSGNGRVKYTAEDNGNVYVLDADKNAKVFEGKVHQGDQIVVEPDQDRIVVAGENADHTDALKAGHRYRVYFQPSH